MYTHTYRFLLIFKLNVHIAVQTEEKKAPAKKAKGTTNVKFRGKAK